MQVKTVWFLVRRTAQSYSGHGCSQLAAAISYYVLFSVVPLLIFLTSVFGLVSRNPVVRQRVIDRVVESAPLERDRGQSLVSDTVAGVSRVSAALSVVGLLGMAWSASAMVGSARRALNVIYGASERRPFVQAKLIDLSVVLGIALLLGASIAASTALQILHQISSEKLGPFSSSGGAFWTFAPLVVPAALTLVAFLVVYRYVPDTGPRIGDLWPGALLAMVLFELMKNGFAAYVAHFNNYDIVYGSLGAVMLFLLWTYVASSILLLGAEFAVQTARLRRDEYADELQQPGASARNAILRFLRGLFVRERHGRPGKDIETRS